MSAVITLNTISTNEHGQFVVLPQKKVNQVLEVLMWLSAQSIEIEVWKN